MQQELEAAATPLQVQILGVNSAGNASGNDAITDGRDLPWLQDTPEVDAWGLWGVTYRDVVVLGPDNTVHAVYNLTEHDLSDPGNYETLKQIFLDAAGG